MDKSSTFNSEVYMRYVLNSVLTLAVAAAAAGCGDNDGLLRTRCQVVKGGENYVTPDGHHLQIQLVPIPEDGKPPNMFYAAEVDQDTGVFRPAGPMKRGMPPGKYQVVLELLDKKKKDVFEGKFDAENSTFVFEFDEDTDEVVVDLDNPPPGQTLVSATTSYTGD
jgi:hypothetical protein